MNFPKTCSDCPFSSSRYEVNGNLRVKCMLYFNVRFADSECWGTDYRDKLITNVAKWLEKNNV